MSEFEEVPRNGSWQLISKSPKWILCLLTCSTFLWCHIAAAKNYKPTSKIERRQAGDLTLWFQNSWSIRDPGMPFYVSPKIFFVKIYMTPGRRLGKAGQQSVIEISDQGKAIYTSDQDIEARDNFCYGEPINITTLDDGKIALTSFGPTAYFHTIVFGVKNGKIVRVLATGSKLHPEFVYNKDVMGSIHAGQKPKRTLEKLDKDSLHQKIITTSVTRETEFGQVPVAAKIYAWDKDTFSYKLYKSVPWGQRFE